MRNLARDLWHSLRTISRNPWHVTTVVLLLGLGIGANAALFAVANSVLLRPLPYGHPERLVVALHNGDVPVSPADYFDYRKNVKSFQSLGAAQAWGGTLLRRERPLQIPGLQVSANMLQVLDVQPLLGRSFTEEEEHSGAPKVLLLSYRLWQQQFGGDRKAIGSILEIDRVPYTVIGVMPREFRFAPFWATRAQMWAPLNLDSRIDDRGGRSLRVFARLRHGVSSETAQAEMSAVAKRLAELYPSTNAKLGIAVVPLHAKVVHSVRPTLLALLGTVGFVLLIACATVSNLLLERAVARRKETALRAALGASRGDLIRMTVVDIAVLAAVSGFAGVMIGNWAIQLFAHLLPPDSIPRLGDLSFDNTAVLFACGVTIVTAVIAGLVPSLQAAQINLNENLKSGDWGNSNQGSTGLFKSWLIATEVALSLVLLAGAGLMMRTMLALQTVDAGFQSRHLLTLQIAASGTLYDVDGRRANLFREVRDQLAGVPGVDSVSAINHLPLGGDIWVLNYSVNGQPTPPEGDQPTAVYRVIMPGYFQTMQIGLVQGRVFTGHDNTSGTPVAIIDEAMAKRRWPGESALGKSIHFGLSEKDKAESKTIVGIVRNARQGDWTSPPVDEIYLPYYQRPDSMGLSYLTFVLRTRGDPEQLSNLIEQRVSAFQKSLPLAEIASMDHIISDELWKQRLATTLVGAFAGLSLLLVAVGVYGIISYSMRQRTREIGIRMALGAQSGNVLGLALREGMRPVLYGSIVGLFSALLLTRFLQSLLYGVTAADPLTFTAVVAGMTIVCTAANLIPALRAARLNPVMALRTE